MLQRTRPSSGSSGGGSRWGRCRQGCRAETACTPTPPTPAGFVAGLRLHTSLATPQDREQIQVLLLPWVGLWRHLQELQQRHGWHVDSRLQAYAAGMLHARVLAVLAASGGSEGLPDVLNDPHFQVLSKL